MKDIIKQRHAAICSKNLISASIYPLYYRELCTAYARLVTKVRSHGRCPLYVLFLAGQATTHEALCQPKNISSLDSCKNFSPSEAKLRRQRVSLRACRQRWQSAYFRVSELLCLLIILTVRLKIRYDHTKRSKFS